MPRYTRTIEDSEVTRKLWYLERAIERIQVTGGSGTSILLQTDGIANSSQSILNLIAGSGITLSPSGGDITINSSGGSTPSLTATQIAFGDGSNLMTSSGDFIYDESSGIFKVTTVGDYPVFLGGGINNAESGLYSNSGNSTIGTYDGSKFKYGFISNPDLGITIDNSGNVGIGTASPSVALDVVGQSIVEDGTGNKFFRIDADNQYYGLGDLDGVSNGTYLVLNDASGILLYDNNSHTGKFGINTYSPSVALEVVGGGKIGGNNPSGIFTDGSFSSIGDWNANGNGTTVGVDDGARLITYAGLTHYFQNNVGIGTNIPSVALDVAGDMNSTGELQLGSSKNSGLFSGLNSTTIGDWNGNQNSNKLTIVDDASRAVYDNTAHDGKFGINVINPSVTLDVESVVGIYKDVEGDISYGTVRFSRYSDGDGENHVTLKYATRENHELILPAADGTLLVSVDGKTAGNSGNILQGNVLSRSAIASSPLSANPGTMYTLDILTVPFSITFPPSPDDMDVYRFNNPSQPTADWSFATAMTLPDGSMITTVPQNSYCEVRYDAASSIYRIIINI